MTKVLLSQKLIESKTRTTAVQGKVRYISEGDFLHCTQMIVIE